MSEEVLHALMQLFAIMANQDGGNTSRHGQFVVRFLQTQVSQERLIEFFEVYHRNLIKTKISGDSKTSMKDSVKTLAICKTINKTLNQKQKVVVYLRLLEFIRQSGESIENGTTLLRTVAEVFNISSQTSREIEIFFGEEIRDMNENFAVVSANSAELPERVHLIDAGPLQAVILFLHIPELHFILVKYTGNEIINLNGQDIYPSTIYLFPPGSSIRHPHATLFYADVSNLFLNVNFDQSINFEAQIELHEHNNGAIALHKLNVSEQSGNLIALMGASGSGKTTLLNVLSGQEKPTRGKITLNGADIYDKHIQLKGISGYIPQHDLLIEELTVYQNLYLAGELCLKDISKEVLHERVEETLESLGLSEIKHIRVGTIINKKISGGQRKRLNIALELIRDPAILFVDEPTSGLSSKDSENVIDLLKQLTNRGKLIFVVIHQPSSDIYKLFSKVILIDVGGYVIFQGDPIEAIKYFKGACNHITSDSGSCVTCGTVNPELLFNLIEAKEVNEFGQYTAYRKITPQQWHERFENSKFQSNSSNSSSKDIPAIPELPGRMSQFSTFLKRDVLAKLSNHQYLWVNLLEVPLLAIVLSLFIRCNADKNHAMPYAYYDNENIPAFFFMSTVVALLVGLTVSAEEIFKDQKILKREAHLQLSRFAYLQSKVLLLFGLSLIQSAAFCLIGFWILEIPCRYHTIFIMVFSMFCFANLVGLLLSSTFNSVVTIYVIIPLIIIPQMILGGAMFNYSELNVGSGRQFGKVPLMADLFASRWAYEGMMTDMALHNPYEEKLYKFNQLESELNYRSAYLLPSLKDIAENRKRRLYEADSAYMTSDFDLNLLTKTLQSEVDFASQHYGFSANNLPDTLTELLNFYAGKFNTLQDKKVKFLMDQNILEKDLQQMYTNKRITEITTQFSSRDKILLDSASLRFHQIMNPIYIVNEPSHRWSVSDVLFHPVKYIGKIKIETFWFNLIMVWVMILLSFMLLYFDIIKRTINVCSASLRLTSNTTSIN